jgi:bifunctional UDP-N-acetylglucosamine pyrophosphorylase/glucosamine-1-phosphate N-acetyltransferase
MTRAMIIPAAGEGRRLGAAVPKLLAPVAGRPMIDHLFDLYAEWVERIVLVVRPDALDAVKAHCADRPLEVRLETQEEPTGMLDAACIPLEGLGDLRPARVWITWCDQVAVHAETVRGLVEAERRHPDAALILPTVERSNPYVHLVRDAEDRIARVRHRREGDAMPGVGENDLGLFSLSDRAAFEWLPEFAAQAPPGAATRERNFLNLLPWLDDRGTVHTFDGRHAIESVGINTPEDLVAVEAHLRGA